MEVGAYGMTVSYISWAVVAGLIYKPSEDGGLCTKRDNLRSLSVPLRLLCTRCFMAVHSCGRLYHIFQIEFVPLAFL